MRVALLVRSPPRCCASRRHVSHNFGVPCPSARESIRAVEVVLHGHSTIQGQLAVLPFPQASCSAGLCCHPTDCAADEGGKPDPCATLILVLRQK